MGRNERGSSESPVRPEGRWTESREGVAKKSLASRLEVSKKRLPLQPATQGAGPAGRRGRTGSLRKCSERQVNKR